MGRPSSVLDNFWCCCMTLFLRAWGSVVQAVGSVWPAWWWVLACGCALCSAAYQSGLNLVAQLLCGVLPEGRGAEGALGEEKRWRSTTKLLVNNYSRMHSNDCTGHGIPSATYSGPHSLLFQLGWKASSL